MAMNEQGIASLGRGGDDQIGHLTTGEKVLPLPVAQDPSVQRVINDAFAKHDLDPNQYTVGHAANSINPNTQFAEFGFFKKLGKAFRKVAQVVGTVVGFVYGGPMGAAIGSTVGGGVRRGKFDLGKAVGDFAGGYTIGSFGQGMGLKGGTFGSAATGSTAAVPSTWASQGVGALKNIIPGTTNTMWNWASTPSTAGGIGGFFQNVGANAAAGLGAPAASTMSASGVVTPIALPGIGESFKNLTALQKAGVLGIGGLAASKLMGDQTLGGPQGPIGLDPQSEQYLTQSLRPATFPTAGIPPEYQIGAYQGQGGVGGLTSPEQQLIEALEAQRRKYQMRYPQFPVGYNEGGPAKDKTDERMTTFLRKWAITPHLMDVDFFQEPSFDKWVQATKAANKVSPLGRHTWSAPLVSDTVESLKVGYDAFIEEFQNLRGQGYNKGGAVNDDGVPIDNIPAMLTEDEHVLTREAIEGLGNGDIERGHMIAKQINDTGEGQERILDEVLQRRYFMPYPKFNVGVS
jgi:hypothetical protein